ncbi:hypothetical protein [Actinobacillus vicugnae]|uniref:hypothetical protein n=1 Tax=Actinobacillus vicugnae TaxID=2573093 RepID=UPI00124120E9|nr:hypothetical protein [Actinobacillus vicugnae]
MKKLLGISVLAMLLAACSNERPHHPYPHKANPAVEEALKACHESVGSMQDREKFDACMQEKGFEKPAQHHDQIQGKVKEEISNKKSDAKKAVKKVKQTSTK